jgi:hypothetical protein
MLTSTAIKRGNRDWKPLEPAELSVLAERLASTSDASEAARLKKRLREGFDGHKTPAHRRSRSL